MLILRKPWDSQPQEVVELAPEAAAPKFAIWHPGAHRNALIGVTAPGTVTNATESVGAGGLGININSISGRWATTSGCGIALGTSEDKSFLIYLDQSSFATSYDYIFSVGTGGSGWGLASRHASVANNAGAYDGVTLHNTGVALPSSGRIAMLACHNAATQTLRVFINGKLVYTATGVTGTAVLSTNTLTIGNVWSTLVNTPYGTWYLGAIVGRDLSHIGRELTNNPWQLFAPRSIWIPVSAGGGTSYTITPSGGITLAGSGLDLRTKVIAPSGGVTFAGTGSMVFASGGTTYTITPSGGVTMGGDGGFLKSKFFTPTGGVTMGGTSEMIKTKIVSPSGGVLFGGTGSMSSNTSTAVQTNERTKVGVGS